MMHIAAIIWPLFHFNKGTESRFLNTNHHACLTLLHLVFSTSLDLYSCVASLYGILPKFESIMASRHSSKSSTILGKTEPSAISKKTRQGSSHKYEQQLEALETLRNDD
jgi:hypothetical protein